ncbi:hypothetical protein C8J56DRAFT_890588 [Mycena floridula]|nr:hypothetical protein C8J56DRAFT_890588 [Mycena floridula]
MPSFSLTRRFGKQHKAIINSPVSSGLVEQHIGHTMADISQSGIGQQSQAGNVFSVSGANNSHGLTADPLALSQHMEGVSIRNIKGNMMSNNQVNITNYYQLQAKDSDARMSKQFAVLRVGDIYLEEEFERYMFVDHGLQKICITASFRHPNILQLYGVCCSPHLTALVFHGAPYFMKRRDYYKSLPSSQWMTHYLKLHQQNEPGQSAHSMLEAHNLRGVQQYIVPLIPRSAWPLKPILSSKRIYLTTTVYSIPGWNKVVNGMDGIMLTLLPHMTIRWPDVAFQPYKFQHSQSWNQSGYLNKMMRHYLQPGPAKQTASSKIFLSTSWIYKLSIPDWKNDTESPGLNNLLETEHLYLFCPLKGAGNMYWSQDEQGQHIIEDSLIQVEFGITVCWHWNPVVYHIPYQYYEILRTIHEACWFYPCSTQIAEYLGLPLAMINNGHSGWKIVGMEDPEYTSESESGDSNYVSPSEDV